MQISAYLIRSFSAERITAPFYRQGPQGSKNLSDLPGATRPVELRQEYGALGSIPSQGLPAGKSIWKQLEPHLPLAGQGRVYSQGCLPLTREGFGWKLF